MKDHTSPMWTEEDQAASEPDFYGKWIDVESQLPSFDESVIVCCRIMGRFLATYSQIGSTGCGHWCDWNGSKGILPPVLWMPLPPIPEGIVK